MNTRHPFVKQIDGLSSCVTDPNFVDAVLVFLGIHQLLKKRLGNTGSTNSGDPLDLIQIQDRQKSRHDWLFDTDSSAPFNKPEKRLIVIEELSDDDMSSRSDLPLQISQISFEIGCLNMLFRISGYGYPKSTELPNVFD